VGNMDALNSILVLALIAILVDSIRGLITKSPPYLIAPFVRLWRETAYLRNILHDKRFAQWRPETARYVALCAIRAQSGQEMPRPVLDLLRESLKRGEPVILLGEPGAGKTTALEAFTYRLAQRAYFWNILLWLVLLSIAALLSHPVPLFALLWLASFLLWEALARRATVPIFLEARSDYTGGEVEDWIENVLKTHLGAKPLLGSYWRAVLLVDGVNEVRAGLYETFVEGWRSFLRAQRRAILTSRTGEDPSGRLEGSTVVTICDLDDAGVQEFLQVYGREKARVENRRYTDEDVHRDFEELRNKNLLGEKSIGRNPYWLKMVVESGLYTRNRGALFRRFAERLIRREIEEKPEERKRRPEWKTVPLEVEMDALGSLALAMHREQRIGYSGEKGWETARRAISATLGDLPYTPDDVLGQAEAATLVRTKYKERVEFVHQLVQEFFAAWALRNRWREALDHVEDVWWWETLFLLGGLLGVSEYRSLVAQTIGSGQTPRLFAAIGFLGSVEGTPPEVSESVIAKLVASVGERLTDEQERSVRELGRILGDGEAAGWFGALFRTPDRRKVKTGAMLLCAVGGKRATEILLDALRDPWGRETTADILASIGASAIEPLIAALRYPDREMRKLAARALAKIGAPAVGPLIAVLRDSERDVRQCAAEALVKIGIPAVEPLIATLRDRDKGMRRRSAEALAKIGTPAVEPLVTALSDQDDDVRWRAAEALGVIGDHRAVESLCALLRDPNTGMRRLAANVLRRIGNARAVEPLIAVLSDQDEEVRRSAAEALGRIGDTRAVGPLIDALDDPDVGVRRRAAKALGIIGDHRAVEPLNAALCDPDKEVRRLAANALRKIGDARAVEPLIAALSDRDEDVRQHVAEVLGSIGDVRAVEPLIAALGDQDENVRWRAVESLERIGDVRAVEPLIDAMRDLNEEVRKRAAEALVNIGVPAVGPLIVALHDQSENMRWYAAEVLVKIGTPAVEPLIAVLRDPDKGVRGLAASALGAIGDARAVEPLIAALRDLDGWVRGRAAEALGRIGDARALLELERLARKDMLVANAARNAIARIRQRVDKA